MKIEIWKDQNGYQLELEDAKFELTTAAFQTLLEQLTESLEMDSDYRVIMLDLAEDE